MLKEWFKKQDEKFDTMLETYQNQLESIQRQSASIQRMTYQIRQLTENQSYIPQGPFSDDNLAEEEAEQNQESEVSFQEPILAKSMFDFYYSDFDSDEEAELFVSNVPIKIENEILYPQNEDLGVSIA